MVTEEFVKQIKESVAEAEGDMVSTQGLKAIASSALVQALIAQAAIFGKAILELLYKALGKLLDKIAAGEQPE